jgi:hypothetical protein
LFLRNKGHTYLLIESAHEEKVWRSWFAPDPKRVLAHLREELRDESRFSDWDSLFPLVRQAHREAHPSPEERENPTYLQGLISRLYHADSLLDALAQHLTTLK